MAIPTLSGAELESARAAATDARRARAALKEQVKSGVLTLGEALDTAAENEALARIKVIDLLRSLPRVGVTRSQEIMETLDIAANRRVRGLGRHQIQRLKDQFPGNRNS